MNIVRINELFVCLEIETQAGTYIKEFVHSDMGRTVPSLSDLLPQKDLECDIVLLDGTSHLFSHV